MSVAKALFSPPLSADVSAALAATLMRAAKLMGYEDLRAAFAAAGGLEDLMSMLTALTAAAAADAHTGTQDVLEAVLMLATAASLREEKSKCKLMDSGFVDLVVSRLLAREDTPVVLLIPAAAVVRSVTTGDDEKEYTSKAFIHARTLASTVSAHKVLLALLRRLGASPAADHAGVMVSLLTSLRQVAANEEICRELGDDGCVATCLGIATGWAATWEVVTAATNLLRQMAGSDGIKKILSEQRGIETALAVQSSHKQAEVVEAVLGLLATTSLRHPEICDQMAQAGCPDMVVDVMGDYAASAPVMRQACMLVRNMVVRNAHLRPVFLEKGVEARLRSAKAAHPASCKDVGAAALRDLGLDNYND